MGYIQNAGGSGASIIHLNLRGYASASARSLGDMQSSGAVAGSGSYTISRVFVDKIECTSGSMTVSYTNSQGQSTSQSLSSGQSINIGNNNNIILSWSARKDFSSGWEHRDSGDSVSASIEVNVYV